MTGASDPQVSGICMQVTAYQVIQSSGATGKMPTQVQFKIADPSDQSVGICESCAQLVALLVAHAACPHRTLLQHCLRALT